MHAFARVRPTAPRSLVARPLPGLVLLLVAGLLAGCGGQDPATETGSADTTRSPGSSTPAEARSSDAQDALATALAHVPAGAEAVTITDWDAIRARLGVAELTSEDPITDRTAFWEQVRTEAVTLTDGQLSAEASRFELDAGFTRDDVDWEAHWVGPEGPGWALGMRPDLEMALVRTAIDDGLLAGRVTDHVVLNNGATAAGSSEPTEWATLIAPGAATGGEAGDEAGEREATYLHRGCLPLREALGPDADVEDRDRLLARHDIEALEPLAAFAVTYAGDRATAHLGAGRGDLDARAALGPDWPVTGSIGWSDAFGESGTDQGAGTLTFDVRSPVGATGLTLTGELPFAVCPEVMPMEEPTGL